MKKKVGIPRALLFYKFEAMWKTFFEELGAEVVISPKTDKKIKDLAVRYAPDEDCYSTKLYIGHALYLKDKVDYVFIPRFGSDHEENVGCPKFIGLAQVIDALFPDFPKILMPYYSKAKANHGKRRLIRLVIEIAVKFTLNPFRMRRAAKKAISAQKEHENHLYITNSKFKKWLSYKTHLNTKPINNTKKPLRIALVGHRYLLNDSFSNLYIKETLKQKGIDFITSDQMPRNLIEDQMNKLDYNMYFDYVREILGTILYFIENQVIDGILQLAVFSCGPDSIILELASRYSQRQQNTPLLQLVIDELTSEIGFSTRLEAFFDMIDRRR